MEHLNMISEWDKVFPKSDKINHKKITFPQSLRHYPCSRYVCA